MTELPSTDWKELVRDGEAAHLERLAEQLRELQRRRARGRPPRRTLHAKGQAGVEGELEVLPDLPAHARVGLFATPAIYRAYVRFSNGAGVRHHDTAPDVRGIAVKLLGVPGRKLIPGLEEASTQDFLLIQNASGPFRDADEFVRFVLYGTNRALLLPRAMLRFGPFRTLRMIRQMLQIVSRPVTSVATSRYFGALPIKFGAYAAKYALSPHAEPAAGSAPGTSPDYLGEELQARLAREPVVYDFQVQFFVRRGDDAD